MDNPTIVSNVTFSSASPSHRRGGLLGWASFTLGDLRLDGVAVRRRARDGRLILSFPERRDAHGKVHDIIRPISSAARETIEEEVFRALNVAPTCDESCP
jgi:DNA-binding cell septation regulator SpoVG